MLKKTKNIHPLSDVKSEKIGQGTKIWQFAVVLKNASIGSNCNICAHTFIEDDVSIGNNVTIKSGVFIWDGIIIEDNVFIGPNVTFVNDKYPRSKKWKDPERIIIKEGASIGANSTISGGITIGSNAMVGMGSVITKDILPNALVFGNPAKVHGGMDIDGKRKDDG